MARSNNIAESLETEKMEDEILEKEILGNEK